MGCGFTWLTSWHGSGSGTMSSWSRRSGPGTTWPCPRCRWCTQQTAPRSSRRPDRRGRASTQEAAMKFLVLWRLELSRVSMELARAVMRMSEYAQPLQQQGKVVARYHIVAGHGGAWIFDVDSNEELEMLLARAPVYNFAHFDVL